MPAHRKPTKLLELSGAFRKDPARGRARAGEPQPKTELGEANKPEKLNELESACWARIVKLCPAGVLKDCDEVVVELTARLWARVKSGKALAADVTQLRLCLQQLGMTPASRSMVTVPQQATGNEFRDI